MVDVLELLVPWAVTTAAIFLLLRWDDTRMSNEQLARAWPATSKISAVVGFSFVAVPVHFWRTRRGVVGLALGLLWGTVIVGIDIGTASIVELATEGGEQGDPQ